MKRETTIYRCDFCGTSTESPVLDRWFTVQDFEEYERGDDAIVHVCKKCGRDFMKLFVRLGLKFQKDSTEHKQQADQMGFIRIDGREKIEVWQVTRLIFGYDPPLHERLRKAVAGGTDELPGT